MGYERGQFGVLMDDYDTEELISSQDGSRMNVRSHLNEYMKDYVTYAFWLTLLFILVLTLGTIANSEKDVVHHQQRGQKEFCFTCDNQTWYNVPLSWN